MVQTLIVMMIVLAAALYVGARVRRTLFPARGPSGGPGCGSDCGCGK
jgi:hypothetical protein